MEFEVLCTIPPDDAVVAPAGLLKARPGKTSKTKNLRHKIVWLMKLVVLLTAVACLQAWTNGHTQAITLAVKNAPIEKVFKEIRKQTAYSFIYTKEDLVGSFPVTLEVKNAAIDQVLRICFSRQPFSYIIEENHIVIKRKKETAVVDQPNKDIKGRVINESGQPVEGVSVSIKGTSVGTSTNADGVFELKNVNEDAVLVFSGVNVESSEVKVGGKTDWGITLKTKIIEQEGVLLKVNSGYQELSREKATGSYSRIDNAALNQQVGSNILNRLDGMASGIFFPKQQLQNGPNFMVRGFSTINGPKSPLIVLDNFPYDGDVNNINPNDIESITILKDAAAAAIWGALRAANGVIVITTKKGNFNQPLRANVNMNVIITEKPDLHSLRQISSGDYIDVETFLFDKGYYNSTLTNTSFRPAVSPIVEILAKRRSGLITASDSASLVNSYRNIDIRDQFARYIYQQAVTQQYSINFNGGAEKFAYYFSAGYDKSIDQLHNLNNRLTIRSENSYKPINNLVISLGAQYTQTDITSGKPAYGNVRVGSSSIPYLSFSDANGSSLPVAINYRQAYTDTAGAGKLLNWNYYPLDDWRHNSSATSQQDLLAKINLNYQFQAGLSIDVNYLHERQNTISKTLQDLQSYSTRDLINRFSQLNRATGVINYIVPLGGTLLLSNTFLISHNVRSKINYNHTWHKHNLIAFAGIDLRQAQTTGNSSIFYGYNGNLLTTANVDFVNSYPTFINGSFTNIPNGASLSGKLIRFISLYTNFVYSYNNKYSLSISGRKDASNLFGVNIKNKWNPLWSAGGGWEISKESFYQIPLVTYLRLRTTYGFSGITDPSRTGVTTLVYNSAQPPTNFPTARVNQFPNPELRWEKVSQWNIGIDFALKKQIVTGTIEYYHKRGTDLFGAAPFDPTAGLNGLGTIIRNIANMKGKGLDLTIASKNLDNQFKWHTTFLFSYNMSRVTKYYVDSNLRSGSFINNGAIILPLVGQPIYSIDALKWAGLDANGNPQGYIGKNISTDYTAIVYSTPIKDMVYRSVVPVYFGSLINTFGWKALSLSIHINYRLGYYFMKPSLSYSGLFGGGAYIGSSDYASRWRNPGDEKKTNVPSFQYPANSLRDLLYTYSEINIDKADNIKIQYINLSYDIDKTIWRKIPVRNIQVYINASNLGIVWRANKDHIDPDFISSNPAQRRTFAVGLRAGL